MVKFIIFMLLMCNTHICYAKVDTQSVSEEVASIIMNSEFSSDDKSQLHKALCILNNALEEEPENRFLLNLRSQVYGYMGDFQKSRNDLKTIHALWPEFSVYLYEKCTMDEAMGEPKSEYMQCYNKAMKLAAVELGDKKDNSFGYILGLLMAEDPMGKKLAQKFIQKLTDSPMDNGYRDMLVNFKRENFLPKISK